MQTLHTFSRGPERLRAVLLGIAAAVARLEEAENVLSCLPTAGPSSSTNLKPSDSVTPSNSNADDLSSLLSDLSISNFRLPAFHLDIVPPPVPVAPPGQTLLHHPALQLAHSPPSSGPMYEANPSASSSYLKDLYNWASDAENTIKETGCEIPPGRGLNQGDLYLGPGSILAIEGAVSCSTHDPRTSTDYILDPDRLPSN